MQIKKLKERPKDMTGVFVEALVMPQGEVICRGKTVGWIGTHEDPIQLYVKD